MARRIHPLILALFTIATFSTAVADPADADAAKPIAYVPTFGNTGTANRFLHPDLLDQGHAATRQTLQRLHDRGFRRFLVHLPYGRSISKYQFTARLNALEHQDPRVLRAIASLVPEHRVFLVEHPDAEVYYYLGSLVLDHRIDELAGDLESITALVNTSLIDIDTLRREFPDQVGLAIDHVHLVDITDPLARVMLDLDARFKLPLMIEGGRAVRAWQSEAGFARLMMHPFAEQGPVPDWKGEQIILAQHGRLREHTPDWLTTLQSQGFTVCGN